MCGMDAAADYEAPDTIYMMGEGGEGRWYCGGETVDNEWSYSMLLFQREERKGQRLFWKGKGACKVALGFHA
jgi:hypothetical protein